MKLAELVTDVVFPVVSVGFDREPFHDLKIYGTAFRFADSNQVVTASHVVDGERPLSLLVGRKHQWNIIELGKVCRHPTEDVALVEANLSSIPCSFLELDGRIHNSSLGYHCWGYPDDVFYDHDQVEAGGKVPQIPDLVFTTGYVRRNVHYPVPGLLGRRLFELSEIAGAGCSGAPVIATRKVAAESWPVAGLYIGERSIQTGLGPIRERGYAVRFAEMLDFFQTNGALQA